MKKRTKFQYPSYQLTSRYNNIFVLLHETALW